MNGGGKVLVVLVIIASGIGSATFFRGAKLGDESGGKSEFSGLSFRGESTATNAAYRAASLQQAPPQQLETVRGTSQIPTEQVNADQPPSPWPGGGSARLPIPGEPDPQQKFLDGANWPEIEPQPAKVAPAERAYRGHIHKIRDGDTLEELARKYLDHPRRAEEIFEANRHMLTDPEVLPLGASIRIPPNRRAPTPTPQPPTSAPSTLSAEKSTDQPNAHSASTEGNRSKENPFRSDATENRFTNPLVKDREYDDPNRPIPLFGPHPWAKSASVTQSKSGSKQESKPKPEAKNRPIAVPLGIESAAPKEDASKQSGVADAKTNSTPKKKLNTQRDQLVPLPRGALRRARENSKSE